MHPAGSTSSLRPVRRYRSKKPEFGTRALRWRLQFAKNIKQLIDQQTAHHACQECQQPEKRVVIIYGYATQKSREGESRAHSSPTGVDADPVH